MKQANISVFLSKNQIIVVMNFQCEEHSLEYNFYVLKKYIFHLKMFITP